MPTTLQTLIHVPDVGGRRFATLTLGTKAGETIRAEFTALRRVAALLCASPAESLTVEHLATAERRVTEWRTMMVQEPDRFQTTAQALIATVATPAQAKAPWELGDEEAGDATPLADETVDPLADLPYLIIAIRLGPLAA